MNLGQERSIHEMMPCRFDSGGKDIFAEFTTSEGEKIIVWDKDIIRKLQNTGSSAAHVSVVFTYDFGRLRSYEILTVDGRHNYP
jgi:hypothetical protein